MTRLVQGSSEDEGGPSSPGLEIEEASKMKGIPIEMERMRRREPGDENGEGRKNSLYKGPEARESLCLVQDAEKCSAGLEFCAWERTRRQKPLSLAGCGKELGLF